VVKNPFFQIFLPSHILARSTYDILCLYGYIKSSSFISHSKIIYLFCFNPSKMSISFWWEDSNEKKDELWFYHKCFLGLSQFTKELTRERLKYTCIHDVGKSISIGEIHLEHGKIKRCGKRKQRKKQTNRTGRTNRPWCCSTRPSHRRPERRCERCLLIGGADGSCCFKVTHPPYPVPFRGWALRSSPNCSKSFI
jgi:hypothetical protein